MLKNALTTLAASALLIVILTPRTQDAGPFIDPNGRSPEAGPFIDPNGRSPEAGPFIDPNG